MSEEVKKSAAQIKLEDKIKKLSDFAVELNMSYEPVLVPNKNTISALIQYTDLDKVEEPKEEVKE